ncbi:tyrosine-protein phosphatase non-receptor type 21 [Neocloeon triangulifer]|uniref:tyrosine-protein phosphatase non-receptor type 21 n=1 Tax=Neocloeon triangulifer TaxID=2078957 RepID=UPI00286EF527|nr:tyrosine-protein phosphatase non-receptor type 21 [Neocloeon triangulifer]
MPFKLRLKKSSKHYNVVSKTLFVICVELLDSTNVECTLSSESNGQECRDNVCQRLGLQQPELFGLRFATKPQNMHPAYRWIELGRPLKRQLDKYALDPTCMQLRVMYFVTGLSLLSDEITRYHYFLQLKSDVIEGRVSCSPKQAVLLAGYSMQAEFGDHEPGKHTAQYLKDFALFPTPLVQQVPVEAMTEAAILQHSALRGLAQSIAEEYYILSAQQLEGYGQQTFAGKDDHGNEVLLGVCLNGLSVAQIKGHYYRSYKWEDIANVVNAKRSLTIEGLRNMETSQMNFASTDLAKYLWRLCLHQHTFFMQNDQPTIPATQQWYDPNYQQVITSVTEDEAVPAAVMRTSNISGSVPELLYTPECSLNRRMAAGFDRAQSTRELFTPNNNDKLRALLPQYRPAPDYETAVKQKYQQVAVLGERRYQQLLYSSQPEIPSANVMEMGNQNMQHQYYQEESTPMRHMEAVHTYSTPDLQAINDNGHHHLINGIRLLQLFKQPPPYSSISTSTPDLANMLSPQNQSVHSHLAAHGSSPDLLNSRAGPQALTQAYQESPHEYARTLAESGSHHQGNVLFYHHHQLHQQQLPHAHSTEPIYENFPLRYSDDSSGGMRARTSSIQSAPENLPRKRSTEVAEAVNPHAGNVSSAGESSSNVQHLPPMPPGNHSQNNTATKPKKKSSWGTLLGGKHKDEKSESKTSLTDQRPNEMSAAATKDALCVRLERKLADSQMFLEFEHIPRKKEGEPCTCALSQENSAKNRYKDVVCYDYNRVRLTSKTDNRHGYINASHIKLGNGISERLYIAAQAPTKEMLDSYWQMVWETGSLIIIALCARHEENHCPGLHDTGAIVYGDYQVQNNFVQETGHCITSQIRLQHRPSKSSRSIWLLQYAEWGDQGTPYDEIHFIGFLEEVASVRLHVMQDSIASGNWPILIHCQAGAGRTGLFIMTDFLKTQLECNQELDLPGTLLHLRMQRMLSVQTINQYRFIHSVVVNYLKQARLANSGRLI